MAGGTIMDERNRNEIIPPDRASPFGSAVALSCAAALIALPLSGTIHTGADLTTISLFRGAVTGWCIDITVVVLLALSAFTGPPTIRTLALLVFVFAGAVTAAPIVAHIMPPTPFNVLYIAAPLAYAAIALTFPGFRLGFGWFRRGRFTRGIVSTLGLLVLAVVGGLILYFKLIHPDLTHQPVLGMHRFTGITLFAIGVGIAALNAAVEEAAYRGVLMHAMDSVFGGGVAPILIQAAAFGAFHFNSTEPGLAGIAVTVALGLVLGSLRRFSRGMLAPYLVHVTVDIGVWTLGMIELG